MDKIWDGKSFEVGGHWLLWRGWKNRRITQNRHKSNAKKNKKIKQLQILQLHKLFPHVITNTAWGNGQSRGFPKLFISDQKVC